MYKSFHEHNQTPDNWKIVEGELIKVNCNFIQMNFCRCGIHVGIKEYAQKEMKEDV